MAVDITESLFKAMDTIATRKIEQASFDITVQATIVSCEDAMAGKYKIKYQNEYLYAYTDNTEVEYTTGTAVYVLFPGGNADLQKTIIGSVKKLGANYISMLSEEDHYEQVGDNIFIDSAKMSLCSYDGNSEIVIYDCEAEEASIVSIDTAKASEYLSQSQAFSFKAIFQTNLPLEQQVQGNYGLVLTLEFTKSATDGTPLYKDYILDVNTMNGNPYLFTTPVTQGKIYNLDAENFVRIRKITFFARDFAVTAPNKDDDIFVSGLSLYAADELSLEDLSGYYLKLLAPKGTFFTKDMGAGYIITLNSEILIKGKVVSNPNAEYYWFIQNPSVTQKSAKYDQHGGKGWECINSYSVVTEATSTAEEIRQYASGKSSLDIMKQDVVASSAIYKCVAIVNGQVLEKQVKINNYDSNYTVKMNSSGGTEKDGSLYVYNNIGKITLSVSVDGLGDNADKATYAWGITDELNNFNTITENSELNTQIATLKRDIESMENQIANKVEGALGKYQDLLPIRKSELASLEKQTRLDKNVYYNYNADNIVSFVTIACSVYVGDIFIGSDSVKIVNDIQPANYSLVINNGTQVFKYDENGTAPNVSSLENPIDLKALTFDIYDKSGNAFTEESKLQCDISWIVPTENTMLTIDSDLTADDMDENGYKTFKKISTFTYGIASKYNIKATDNNITLQIKYKDEILTAKTNLAFIKEGAAGTNGTDFTARIVPTLTIPQNRQDCIVVNYNNGAIDLSDNGNWVKAELWHDGELIYSGNTTGNSTEGKPVTVTWSILKNIYGNAIEDDSCFTIDSLTGAIQVNIAGIEFLEQYETELEELISYYEENITGLTEDYKASLREMSLNLGGVPDEEGNLKITFSKDVLTGIKKDIQYSDIEITTNNMIGINKDIATQLETVEYECEQALLSSDDNVYKTTIELAKGTEDLDVLLDNLISIIKNSTYANADAVNKKKNIDTQIENNKKLLEQLRTQSEADAEKYAEVLNLLNPLEDKFSTLRSENLKLTSQVNLYAADIEYDAETGEQINIDYSTYSETNVTDIPTAEQIIETYTNAEMQDIVNQISAINNILQGLDTISKEDATWVQESIAALITVLGGNRGTDARCSSLANIIKVEINYDNLIQTAYLPLVFIDCIDSTFKADLGEGGFLEVLYTADGKNPSYNNTKPFVLDASYYVSNTDSYDPITQNSSITTLWDTFGTIYDIQSKKWAATLGIKDNMKILKDEEERTNFPSNAYWMIPVDNSDGYCCTNIVRCRVTRNEQTVLVAYIPVHMLLNKYGNSAINGWDGNGLSLDEEGGVILAPQVGAGIKNPDNTFTGIVIGEAVEGDEDRIGLLGYNHGQRSIFLDAETGKAEFGLNNSGKIVLDPTDRRAKIYSGNFPDPEVNHFKDIDLSESKGMMIDFSTPYIKFGSGTFEVDPFGNMKATSGKIAGWNIEPQALTGGEGLVGMSSIYDEDSQEEQYAFWAGDKDVTKAPFSVTYKGKVQATQMKIGTTSKRGNQIIINDGQIYTIINENAHDSLNSAVDGFYFGEDGISIGGSGEFPAFKVTKEGILEAREGYFGLWSINDNGISYTKQSWADPTEGIWLGTQGISFGEGITIDLDDGTTQQIESGVFTVDARGQMFATAGTIANWVIDTDRIGTFHHYDEKGKPVSTTWSVKDDESVEEDAIGIYIGKSGIRLGKNFYVDRNGKLYAISGKFAGRIEASEGEIGGWTITDSSLKSSGNLELHSNGKVDGGPNWNITAEGKATFNDVEAKGEFTGGASGGGGTFGAGGLQCGGLTVKDGAVDFGSGQKLYIDQYGITASGAFGSQGRIRASEGFTGMSSAGASSFSHSVSCSSLEVNGEIICGSLTCRGGEESKNRTIPTQNYGNKLLTSYETTEPLFGDCGLGQINEDGQCYIALNPIYFECTDRHDDIKVFLTKYGEGDIYFDYQNSIGKIFLLIKGTPGLFFSWEWKLIQKGFGNTEALGDYHIYYENPLKKTNVDYMFEGESLYLEQIGGYLI